MGKVLDRQKTLDRIMRGSATNFIAEIFFDELQFILGEQLHDKVMVICHGMNSRISSKEILNVSTQRMPMLNTDKEFIQIDLARNSLYHKLPELLFHPLVLSKPGMSNKEIVEAIRDNEKQGRELMKFFSPFDTEIFKEKININNRHLNFFSDGGSRKNLTHVIKMLEDKKLSISEFQKYKLFLFLCKSEIYKENLKALEHLLYIVLDLNVRLRLELHNITEDVYLPIGYGTLGQTIGINGTIISEIDDLEAMIMFSEPLNDYMETNSIISNVRGILEYFVLSTRNINVRYMVCCNTDFILGQNRLRYNTNL